MIGVRATVVLVMAALLGVGSATVATAATGDVGYLDQSYSWTTSSGTTASLPNPPTSDKPQSKLWFAQGSWWADMFDTASGTWHIFALDRPHEAWVDTGVQIDDRPNTLADVLWDGAHLYVASHVVTVSTNDTPVASVASSPARLYRYSYSAATGSYSLDAGFPVAINDNSSESLSIDEDSTGTLWATWTQVSGTASGFTSVVYANSMLAGGTAWGTPFVLPVSGSTVSPDDISSVVAFGRSKIGILWSNQLDGGVYWAVHNDGSPTATWVGGPALRATDMADDHLNIKAVQADNTGRVFAVAKTSLDDSPTSVSTDPQIQLLSFKPATGAWSVSTVGTLADCHTRPQLVLDEPNQTVHVFATAPSTGGCPYSGSPGTIYDKTASMTDPVFSPGRGTPVIQDAASANLNDVTTTKQSVNASSGIVVLASNQATHRYWHADLSAPSASVSAPVASFGASSVSGVAPLAVQFSDSSAGGPTSWSWDFGDGGTSGVQNPAHTFAAAGSYTVTLTASNAAGSSSAAVTVTVSAPPAPPAPSSAGIAVRSSSTAGNPAAVTAVGLPRPAGVAAGDVLVAQVTADMAPNMAGVPAGWSQVFSPLSVVGQARVFVYYHVVADPAAEPASYGWTLSAAEKWSGGVTAFSGVDNTTPLDTAASTGANNSYSVRSVTVPGISTVSPGALLIGGVGLDSKSIAVTGPAGWSEAWQSNGGQVAELAVLATTATGSTGPVTWTTASGIAAVGWLTALRPAG